MQVAEGVVGKGDRGPVVEDAPVALLEALQARVEVGIALAGSEKFDEVGFAVEQVIPPGTKGLPAPLEWRPDLKLQL